MKPMHCTPWGKPLRNVFGWQRPCYLLGEGYAASFKELMDDTAWDQYGTGNYEKCADCMVHSGYESTAVMDAVKRPLHILKVALKRPARRKVRWRPRSRSRISGGAEYNYSQVVDERHG